MSKLNAREMRVVEECGKLYNFDSLDALRVLSEVFNDKEKIKKIRYPMPFNGTKKEGCCNGIVKNHGLYTQCEKKVKENEYCKGCEKKPYGSIEERLSKDLYEYKDPKGKGPKRYTEILKKLNISKETIEKEAERLNLKINPIHFEEVVENVKRGRPKTEKKVKEVNGKKGRPKKEKKTVVVNNDNEEDDLFATLIANANANVKVNVTVNVNSEESNVEDVVVAVEDAVEDAVEVVVEAAKEAEKPKKAKKVKEVDPAKEAEKEAEKQKKAEEKAAKEAEKQKKAEEKAAKDAEKEAEKQKKAEEKAAKEAEKQKKAEEKAAKEAEKQKKAESLTPPYKKAEEADVVRKFDFEGKSYYKSKNTGVIYNMEQEVVGKWNEERNEIDFDEEEEEEEYDE
jgi:hypothetical protein